MIEVKLVSGATLYTHSFISLPDFLFYNGWDQSSSMAVIEPTTLSFLIFAFNFYGEQFELKYVSLPVSFNPGVYEVEVPIIRPNSLT